MSNNLQKENLTFPKNMLHKQNVSFTINIEEYRKSFIMEYIGL